MHKIKKYLAAFMTAALILTNITTVMASNVDANTTFQYSDADEQNFKFSYGFYKALGIVNEELNIDSTISRGSWAEIIIRFFHKENEASSYVNQKFFADYDAKYEKIGYVNLAAQLGFMGEYDDGKFCPDVDVSYDDAIISIVKGLGYETIAESRGGGNEQYIQLAAELGLLDKVAIAKGYPITASVAMKILDNALEAELLGAIPGKNETYKKGETVLSQIFKLKEAEGIVTANYQTSLYSADKTREGQIKIEDVPYSYSGYARGLVGYNVRYYVDSEDTVVYLGKYDNELEVIDFDNIYKYENRTYYYTEGESEKLEDWEIPSDCAVLYNGTAIEDSYASSLPMYTEDGSLTLVNNDNDKEADVLLIEAYTSMFIGYIDSTEKVIYNFYNGEEFISLDKYEFVQMLDEDGNETTLDKIPVKSVITIATTPDRKSVTIDVCTETVEGKVTGKKTDDFNRTILKLDGVNYTVSSICDVTDVSNNFTGIFYLNKKGQIVGFDEKILTPVGYLIDGYMDYDSDRVVLRILTSGGTITRFRCTEKVKVVGEDGRYLADDLYRLLRDGEDKPKSQVVLYELDENEEIKSLDLLNHSDRISQFNVISGTGVRYLTSGSCFTDRISHINNGAIIFYVPMSGGSITDYGVMYKSDLQNDQEYSSANYSAYLYQLEGSQLGADIMVIDQSLRSRKYAIGIIKSIENTLDEHGEPYHVLQIYQYASLNTYYVYKEDGVNVEALPGLGSAYNRDERVLDEGDVVSLDYIPENGKKYLSRLAIIYDISEDEYLYNNPNNKEITVDSRYFFGGVKEKDNKLISVVVSGGIMQMEEEMDITDDVNRADLAANYEVHLAGGTVYLYNEGEDDAVVKGSINDIAAEETVGPKYSKIWMFSQKESPQMIYIVNK